MSQDEYFMAEAVKEAAIAAELGDFPIGCVLVIDGEIVARGRNAGYSEHNRLAHAEIKILTEAREILEAHKGQATLYTTYEPCPMCFGAIVLMKIGRVVTGIDIDQSGCLHLQQYLPPFWQHEKFHFEVTRGVLEKECKEVFRQGKMADEYTFQP